MTEGRRTCEGFNGQLRLLGVNLIFHYGVNVRQYKLHTAHCSTQLSQRIGARFCALSEKKQNMKVYD